MQTPYATLLSVFCILILDKCTYRSGV
jgi:hypothetical protein